MTTYFLIINQANFKNQKLDERIEECKKYPGYNDLGSTPNGYMFYDGNEIDLFEFYKGNMKIIKEENISNLVNKKSNIEIEFLDF